MLDRTDWQLTSRARRNGHPHALRWWGLRREGTLRTIECRACGATIGSYSARYLRPAAADFAIADHRKTHAER